MKNVFVGLAAAVVVFFSFSCIVFAAEEVVKTDEAEESSTVSFQSGVLSKYVDENGSVLHNKPVVQSELIVSVWKGIYFYAWHSAGIDDSNLSSNSADELDFGIGREWEMVGLTYDVGFLYNDLIGLGKFEKTDVWEPYVKVSKVFPLDEAGKNTLMPYILAEYFIPNGTKEFNGGLYVHGGVEYAWKGKEISLKQKIDLLYDDGAFGFNKALIGSYEARADVAITKWLGLYGGFKLTTPVSHVSESDGRKFEAIPGAGIKFQF